MMYSPQSQSPLRNVRGKSVSPRKISPYRVSPIKRNLPQDKMTLEEFMESKRKRFKSTSPSSSPQKRTNFINKNSSTHEIKPGISSEQKIQVCVRKRPLSKQEIIANEKDIAPLKNTRTIEILAPKQKVDLTNYIDQHSFTFDYVFDSSTSNRTIYQKTTYPLIEHMFQGGKATCFAYGQTGSGKTYTMLDTNHGLYFQAINDIFRHLQSPEHSQLQAWMGYYEIYQGQLLDLLNGRKKLIPREDGKGNIILSGIKEYRIHSPQVMKQVFDFGNRERTTCKTSTNNNSSRSHAILQILLKKSSQVYGKLNFIDLAGSERGTDRGHNPDVKTRMEGAEINRSLLALKECIRALDQDKKHAPFRGSKLTMVLRDSFIGNSKTCMIATVSPNHSNSDHTLNTLRYADRVKELKGESDPRLLNNIPTLQSEPDMNIPAAKITKEHIKNFIKIHELQIEACELYLRSATNLLNEFQFNFDELAKAQDSTFAKQLLQEKYNQYQSDLLTRGEHFNYFSHNLITKIKQELADEYEEDDPLE